VGNISRQQLQPAASTRRVEPHLHAECGRCAASIHHADVLFVDTKCTLHSTALHIRHVTDAELMIVYMCVT
jgi:hypothetical protein